MEIKFNGDFTVKKTPQQVYDFLVDPNRFCPLLPDYQSMEILDAKNFLVKLSVGISHIRGTAAVKMSLVETKSPDRAVYEGRGEVPGGSASRRAGGFGPASRAGRRDQGHLARAIECHGSHRVVGWRDARAAREKERAET